MTRQEVLPTPSRRQVLGVTATLVVLASIGTAADARRELRVCADPDNLPYSSDQLNGFENKIAEVIARDLNASVQYTWFPQRRGFIRKTLGAGKCDLVVGVPNGYDPVLTTKPYYSSSYVFVYAKDKDLDLHSLDDPVLTKIRIGLQAFGDDGANSPAALALTRRGIIRNIIGFPLSPTNDSPPGKIIHAVAAGQIDVAIVWGPFGGYFASREPAQLNVVPVSVSPDLASLPFIYEMCMGVRRGDEKFREELDAVLDRRLAEIQKILGAYGVPLVGSTRAASASTVPVSTTKVDDVKER
jgi:mxaJ protein